MSIQSQISAEISHFLGLDFGKSKVGLAMADSETKMAFGYGTLKNDRDLIENLDGIIKKENIRTVIIGIPKYANGETIGPEARKLGETLKETLKVEVFYQEEMFTTKMAQANLKEKGEKDIKRLDDKESARIILEEWLNSR